MTVSSAHRTSIVLVNYNGYADTIECLESLLRLDDQNFQIVIVDNDSTNNSVLILNEWVEKYFKNKPTTGKYYLHCKRADLIDQPNRFSGYRIILVEAGENLGFAGGNNIGISLGLKNGSEYFWLLNNDTTVPPSTLTHLIIESNKTGLGILGCRLQYYHKPDTIQALGGRFNKLLAVSKHVADGQLATTKVDGPIYTDIDYVVGASMFVSRNFILDVGLISEDYFLYFEELDWACRARAKGWKIGTALNAVVFHKEGASAGSGHWSTRSMLSDFLIFRNRFIFISKFYPNYLPFTYLSSFLIILNRYRRGQFQIGNKMLEYMMKLNPLKLRNSIYAHKQVL